MLKIFLHHTYSLFQYTVNIIWTRDSSERRLHKQPNVLHNFLVNLDLNILLILIQFLFWEPYIFENFVAWLRPPYIWVGPTNNSDPLGSSTKSD